MSKPALVSAMQMPSGAVVDFSLARRECGTAPGGATRSSRSPHARRAGSFERQKEVHALLKDEAWFADVDAPLDDDLGFDDRSGSPIFMDDEDDEDDGGNESSAACSSSGAADTGLLVGDKVHASTASKAKQGGTRLSPRCSFERVKRKGAGAGGIRTSREPSDTLKGLLNSKDMEDRLVSAAQNRLHPTLHPNLRLMIPSPIVGSVRELERPPSRQRNLPMHLHSDLSLELPSHDGQLSPEVERKWAHYASTPRPQSRHKSPPDAVFLDLPAEP